MQLPTEVELRYCGRDNFLFLAGGRQGDYDEYYTALANDSVHQEVSAGAIRSPVSKLQSDYLAGALDGFFTIPRNVLDLGCGEGSLLIELAANFPSSTFFGFEPGPAALTAFAKAKMLGLQNLSIASREDKEEEATFVTYDLVIASHVIEHMLDFDLLHLLPGFMVEGALLYVEVPNSLNYDTYQRLEFLYYFDRLHVNHFSPLSLARLMSARGFGYVKHFEYAFPYGDGGEYPALGMLFRKGGNAADLVSPNLLDRTNRYIGHEKERAKIIASQLDTFEGILVWGVGDNFYRSIENGGPLSSLRHMVLLDRRSHEITIGNRKYQTIDPRSGVRDHPWPVVVTISQGRNELSREVRDIDPARRVIFV